MKEFEIQQCDESRVEKNSWKKQYDVLCVCVCVCVCVCEKIKIMKKNCILDRIYFKRDKKKFLHLLAWEIKIKIIHINNLIPTSKIKIRYIKFI